MKAQASLRIDKTRQGLHFMHTPSVKVYVSQTKKTNAYACFEEASREGSCKPAHWGLHFMQTPSVEVYVGKTETKNLAYLIGVHACLCRGYL